MKVTNNRVIDCQRAVGILAGGKDIVVKGNWVQRTTRQGIWFMGAEHSEIVGNTIVDISGTHANGISVYLFSKDVLVAGNKVLKTGSAFTYEGNGDKPPKAEGLCVYGNLFDGAVNSWGSKMGDVPLVNNTFLGPANVGGDSAGRSSSTTSSTGRGRHGPQPQPLHGAGLVAGRPVQVVAGRRGDRLVQEGSRRDLRRRGQGRLPPQSGSPALDAGMDPTQYLPVSLFPDYDFAKDIDGNPRARQREVVDRRLCLRRRPGEVTEAN